MTPEVVGFGEVLIDFSQHGLGPLGFPAYEALPGGGVANMVVALARWGHSVGFAGRVGDDALGVLLTRTLREKGVDVSRVVTSSRPTTMAIVSNDAQGDRSFDFLWKGTSCEAIPAFEAATGPVPYVFHFSSVSMSDPEGRRNNLASALTHRQAGAVVTFDPNLRTNLWTSAAEARSAIREGLMTSDIVKIAEEEVAFVLDEPLGDSETQARTLGSLFPTSVLLVTRGAQGCLWLSQGTVGHQEAPQVQAVDTTGAGDCFMAGAVHVFLRLGKAVTQLTPDDVAAIAQFGVAAGSASTTRRGGIPSIPSLEEVETLVKRLG